MTSPDRDPAVGTGPDRADADWPGSDHSPAAGSADWADGDRPGPDRDPAGGSGPEHEGADGPGSDRDTVEWATGLHDPAAVGDPGDWIDGTDPAYWSDADVTGDPFPPALDLDVHPADGGPWVDPALLGGRDAVAGDPSGTELVSPADPPEALRSDLAAADGNPDADWDTLRDSDDPAVRALANHWTP
jgi:hypothetical protein